MKYIGYLASLIFVFFSFSAFGQPQSASTAPAGGGAPPGGSNKNLADDLRKSSSMELERIRREADQKEADKVAPINNKIAVKFPEIKEDFEEIQLLQAAIIKAYTTGKKVDYSSIENSALGINKHAKRLEANLFAEIKKEKKKEKAATEEEKPKEIRELIVELDNAVGSFVSSKIFANLQVIEPNVAISTKTDLLRVQALSQKLAEEAKKMQ